MENRKLHKVTLVIASELSQASIDENRDTLTILLEAFAQDWEFAEELTILDSKIEDYGEY